MFLGDQFQGPAGIKAPKILLQRPGHLGQVYHCPIYFSLGDLEEPQQITDEKQRILTRFADIFHVLMAFFLEPFRRQFKQSSAEAVDHDERGFEIMGHGLHESLKLLVGIFDQKQVLGQFRVQGLYGFLRPFHFRDIHEARHCPHYFASDHQRRGICQDRNVLPVGPHQDHFFALDCFAVNQRAVQGQFFIRIGLIAVGFQKVELVDIIDHLESGSRPVAKKGLCLSVYIRYPAFFPFHDDHSGGDDVENRLETLFFQKHPRLRQPQFFLRLVKAHQYVPEIAVLGAQAFSAFSDHCVQALVESLEFLFLAFQAGYIAHGAYPPNPVARVVIEGRVHDESIETRTVPPLEIELERT